MEEKLLSRKEIEEQIDSFESIYNTLTKRINEYVDYLENVSSRTKDNAEIKEREEEIEKLRTNYISLEDNLSNSLISLERKQRKKITNILDTARKKLPDFLNKYEKAKKDKNENMSQSDSADRKHSVNTISSANSEMEMEKMKLEGKIEVLEYKDTFLEDRQKQLESVKTITGQCYEISESIRTNVHNQGQMLDEIENNVVDMKDNVEKGAKEVKEINQLSKKQNKRIIIIILIALFLLLISIYSIYKTFIKK